MKAPTAMLGIAVGAVALLTLWQFGTASGAQGNVTVYKARAITVGVYMSSGYVGKWTYNGTTYQTIPVATGPQALALAEQMIDMGAG